eukprot:1157630-Pelagomonas_calceolata.AAC.5
MPVLEALAMDPVSCALCCFLELMCVGVNARIHTQSLCYNLPILEALAMDPDSCALYCFPTKALAQVRRQWHKNCACAPGQTMLAREKKSAAMKLCRAAAPCAAFQVVHSHMCGYESRPRVATSAHVMLKCGLFCGSQKQLHPVLPSH